MLRSRAKLQLKDYTSGAKMGETGSSGPNLSAFIVSDFSLVLIILFPFLFLFFFLLLGRIRNYTEKEQSDLTKEVVLLKSFLSFSSWLSALPLCDLNLPRFS